MRRASAALLSPCWIGPVFCPVLTEYHLFAGSAFGKHGLHSIQSLSVLAPKLMPVELSQFTDEVADWHRRSTSPIALDASWLSVKLTVTVRSKQVGSEMMQADVVFTAIGATLFIIDGTLT